MKIKSINQTVSKLSTRYDWKMLIEEWQKSHQTKVAFCQARGLVYHQFKYYYYQSCKDSSNKSGTSTVTATKTHTNFVPVKLHTPVVNARYEIQFPSGVVIKVPLQESLASVIKALGVVQ